MKQERLITALTPEFSCTDIKRSIAFYKDVLGFKIQYERKEDGFAMMERQGSRIMLDELRKTSVTGTDRSYNLAPLEYPFGRGMNLQIETTDVDALYGGVQKSGAVIYRPLEEMWYRADNVEMGNRQFIVLDPDGYMLRFFQHLGERTNRRHVT